MRAVALVFCCACGARTDPGAFRYTDAAPVDNDAPRDPESQVSLSDTSICFRKAGGVQCWGSNAGGYLGDGTFDDHYSPQKVGHLSWVNELSAGDTYFCARVADGAVWCWGENQAGQLGLGYLSDAGSAPQLPCTWCVAMPSKVIDVNGAVALTPHGSGQAACAMVGQGSVFCWGSNRFGEIAEQPLGSYGTPVEVLAFKGATSVAMGSGFSCGLFADGTVHCVGRNAHGELGNGSTVDSVHLTQVIGVSAAVAIACGTGAAYALLSNGDVLWWGTMSGVDGSATDAGVGVKHLEAVSLGVTGGRQVATAGGHVCVLTESGVECAGLNYDGQLGDGTQTSRSSMAPVVGVNQVVSVATGARNTCVIERTGALVCWGDNGFGQLGTGVRGPAQTKPIVIGGL